MDTQPNKYKNKYRIQSTRLKSWNYAWDGYYFVTININNRRRLFGEIKNKKVILNSIGGIAQKYWLEIPDHFSNVRLDEYIVMPDHVHGIIVIDNGGGLRSVVETLPAVETLHCNVSTGCNNGTFQNKSKKFYSNISPKPKSLSTIIRSYKSVCTKNINKSYSNVKFQWQPRFYDSIICNEQSLQRVRRYIRNNPINENP